jgi:hypothetical protein
MSPSKAKVERGVQRDGEPQLIPDDLRGWIEQVIVPILVQEFIRAQGLRKEAKDG